MPVLRLTVALLLGKLIYWLTRTARLGGGSAAPGLYALKIDPNLINKLVKQIPKNIVITGTNGKTTTARMLADFANRHHLKIIRNYTGSNLERGIASALISHAKLLSFPVPDLGIWEVDEAAFNSITPKLNPQLIIFLNAYRDQLDRYGEVDIVVKHWGETLKKLNKDTLVLINGDDDNTRQLDKYFPGQVKKFGTKDLKITGELTARMNLPATLRPGNQSSLDFEAKDIKLKGLSGSQFTLTINHKSLIVNLPIPGLYNIYNALAALACASCLQIPKALAVKSLAQFHPAFGRVEKFVLTPLRWQAKTEGYIFLVKNPIGATQVLATLATEIKPGDRLLIVLNDNLADGQDVSWIWDADFEVLLNCPQIYVSGSRAQDLAVRLKYAGLKPNSLMVENDLQKTFKEAAEGLKGRLFILPTYTAMLKLQDILVSLGIKKHYWREG